MFIYVYAAKCAFLTVFSPMMINHTLHIDIVLAHAFWHASLGPVSISVFCFFDELLGAFGVWLENRRHIYTFHMCIAVADASTCGHAYYWAF